MTLNLIRLKLSANQKVAFNSYCSASANLKKNKKKIGRKVGVIDNIIGVN